MTYPEAIQWLYDLRLFGAKLGLENPRRLAALAANPQDRLRILHVAGTNGKGSVCAMLESICRHAGMKTGLFTSPHLVSFRERIQVNRQLISEPELARLADTMRDLLTDCPTEIHPTFFEAVTVLALKHFAESKCEIVLLETGLGGRLDATNIVTPAAAILTPVALDHQQWLGDTLPEIAAEKAGIIKPRVPVISALQDNGARVVIEQAAAAQDAPLTFADSAGPLNTPLAGEHQKQNATLAAITAQSLGIDEHAIRDGLANVHWPARGQWHHEGERRILLDAAHNPASMRALVDILKTDPTAQLPAVLLGMSGEKNWREMCRLIAPLAARVVAVPTSTQKSQRPEIIAETCGEFCAAEAAPSIPEGLERLAGEPLVVVAGSIYLVGEVMERLNVSPQPETDERGLNEWKMDDNAQPTPCRQD